MQTKQSVNASSANNVRHIDSLLARARQTLQAYEDPVTVAHMRDDQVLVAFGKYRAAEGLAFARTGAPVAEFDA